MHKGSILNKKYNKIYHRVYLNYTNKKDCKYLQTLGFIKRKSAREFKIPKIINKTLVHHFIRGYFDGDGSICFRKKGKQKGQKRFELVAGHPSILEDIRKILIKVSGARLNVRQQNPHKCWAIETSGTYCNSLYDYLYQDATIYLERKKILFQSL